jgi:hypothetical protein
VFVGVQMGQLHLHKSVCDCHQLDPTNEVIREQILEFYFEAPECRLSADAAEVLDSQSINLDKMYHYALDLFLSRIIVAKGMKRSSSYVLTMMMVKQLCFINK